MLLPTSAIAEITDYSPPAPLDNTPDWLLGQVEWEDWQVPVISFGALVSDGQPEAASARSRIMVVKSLSNTTRVPYIGVLVSEIPRLANIAENDLKPDEDREPAQGAHAHVAVGNHRAAIPDLDRLAQLVGHAAYGSVEKGESAAAEA